MSKKHPKTPEKLPCRVIFLSKSREWKVTLESYLYRNHIPCFQVTFQKGNFFQQRVFDEYSKAKKYFHLGVRAWIGKEVISYPGDKNASDPRYQLGFIFQHYGVKMGLSPEEISQYARHWLRKW